jgi:hypothetical protein
MIDPSSQLAAMVRAQFGAQRRVPARRDPAPRHAGQGDATIQQTIALRVRALSPDDPQRQRKAFRIFLESVLMQAFGRRRPDAHGFDQLVDTVLHRMEDDAALEAALREAGGLLLADVMPATSR